MRFSKMTTGLTAFVCGGSIAIPAAQAQNTWYVDDDGAGGNGCTTWADSCPELQTALVLANSGDKIWDEINRTDRQRITSNRAERKNRWTDTPCLAHHEATPDLD